MEENYKKAINDLHHLMMNIQAHRPFSDIECPKYVYNMTREQENFFRTIRKIFYDICKENNLPYSRHSKEKINDDLFSSYC